MNHICKYCGKEFENGIKLGGHVSKCKYNPNNNQTNALKTIKDNFEKNNPLEEYILICPICGKEFIIQVRHKQFEQGKYKKTCSRSCASKLTALHTNLEEKNKKISKALEGNIPVNRNEGFSYFKECKYCGKIFDIRIRNNKSDFCSDECMKNSKHIKLSEFCKKINFGGYNPNSIKNHHHGNYKGIHCDSSWELAYLVYCLEHSIQIERCAEVRYYKLNKQIRRYIPDFIVNGEIIEIKGYFDKVSQIKSEQNPDIKVLFKEDLAEAINYTINKYGHKFWEVLYE